MKIWLERAVHRGKPVYTLRRDSVVIDSRQAVAEWKRKLDSAMRTLGSERVYLLIDVTGFEIDPAFAAEYGKVAKRMVEDRALAVLRYGDLKGMTASTVRLQAVIHKFSSNVFRDRAAALVALDQILDQSESA